VDPPGISEVDRSGQRKRARPGDEPKRHSAGASNGRRRDRGPLAHDQDRQARCKRQHAAVRRPRPRSSSERARCLTVASAWTEPSSPRRRPLVHCHESERPARPDRTGAPAQIRPRVVAFTPSAAPAVEIGRTRSSVVAPILADLGACFVAHAIARAARAGGAKRSSGPQQPDARVSLSPQLGLVPAPAVDCSCLERKREDERRDAYQRPVELGQPR